MRKYLVPTIGAIAFVVGGLIARTQAIEGIETLERTFSKKSDPETEAQ